MSYSRLVISRTLAETKAVWNIHRIWIYFASPLTGLLVRGFLRGIKQVGDWQQLLLYAFLGFVITWLGTLLVNLIRVPGILHAEQAAEIAKLKELAYPKVQPEEKKRRNMAAQKIKGASQQSKKILRCILDHGKILVPVLVSECGFTHEDIYRAIQDTTQNGLLFSDRETVWVNDEFKSALDYLLRLEGL